MISFNLCWDLFLPLGRSWVVRVRGGDYAGCVCRPGRSPGRGSATYSDVFPLLCNNCYPFLAFMSSETLEFYGNLINSIHPSFTFGFNIGVSSRFETITMWRYQCHILFSYHSTSNQSNKFIIPL